MGFELEHPFVMSVQEPSGGGTVPGLLDEYSNLPLEDLFDHGSESSSTSDSCNVPFPLFFVSFSFSFVLELSTTCRL